MPRYLAVWTFCDQDNDVYMFTQLYEGLPEHVTADAYRACQGLSPNAGVTDGELEEWHDGLCQTGHEEVFQIADDGVVRIENLNTHRWCKLPCRKG